MPSRACVFHSVGLSFSALPSSGIASAYAPWKNSTAPRLPRASTFFGSMAIIALNSDAARSGLFSFKYFRSLCGVRLDLLLWLGEDWEKHGSNPRKKTYARQENDFYCSHGHDCIVARVAVSGTRSFSETDKDGGRTAVLISWGLPRLEGHACAELTAARRNRDTIALGSGVYLSEIGSLPRCSPGCPG